MVGRAEWKAESKNCEGMSIVASQGNDVIISPYSSASASQPVSVPAREEEVALNMIIHQIHDRGLGAENWTYNEAAELLRETIVASPDLLEEFQEDFFAENESVLGKQ